MAVQPIRVYPDPILKQVCEAIAGLDEQVDDLVQDLIDTMVDSGHSVGVAAPQIGVCKRVVVVDVSHSKLGAKHNHGLLVMINPEIIEREGEKTMREGCMSVPDYTGNVSRAKRIMVQFLDREGHERVVRARDFEAVAIQHELDHLDGLLFLDRVSSLKTDVFRRKS
ncbi:MAG: peptide deformylase [Desulfuromonas sp.]|nr:MAG: peptide deformylase [Desulfuromonas sp.]